MKLSLSQFGFFPHKRSSHIIAMTLLTITIDTMVVMYCFQKLQLFTVGKYVLANCVRCIKKIILCSNFVLAFLKISKISSIQTMLSLIIKLSQIF